MHPRLSICNSRNMPAARPDKTLTDYVAIAISPVLIMLLVGSLTFFLSEVLARKAASTTFHWILFWYTVATVLIARIGIEQGRKYAAGYGLALAGATSLVLIKLAGPVALAGIVLLGVAWWATDRLTWDCTLIDEREDASGEGLLRKAGLERRTAKEKEPAAEPEADDTHKEQDAAANTATSDEEESKKAAHAPGVWVVYFSLAALPLFGLGQMAVPAEGRRYAFKLLWVYVASALALLVTTSFLGLRRYLRQRKLQMPAAVTTGWLVTGGGLILTILILCLLIPRPAADFSLIQAIDKVSTKVQQASDYAFLKGEAGEGDGNRIGDRDDDDIDKGEGGGQGGKEGGKGEGGGKSKPGGQGDGKAKQGGGNKTGKGAAGKGKGGKKPKDGQQGDQQAADGDAKEGNNDQSSNNSSSPSKWVGSTFKTIIYLLLAIVAIFVIYKYREQIAAGLKQFLADLRNLFGGKKKSTGDASDDAGEAGEYRPQPRPFAAFADPFSSGSASQMATESVIAYTFEAMEAWAYEQGIARKVEQTPIEFAREISERLPGFAEDAMRLARLYTRSNYADRPPSDRCREVLAQTWRAMAGFGL